MLAFNALDGKTIKERVDMTQLRHAWVDADDLRRHGFLGSMNRERRNGKEHLYSRKGKLDGHVQPMSCMSVQLASASALAACRSKGSP